MVGGNVGLVAVVVVVVGTVGCFDEGWILSAIEVCEIVDEDGDCDGDCDCECVEIRLEAEMVGE